MTRAKKLTMADVPMLESNLQEIFEHASCFDVASGVSWYRNAHDECDKLSRQFSVVSDVVYGVVAVLSPGLRWEKNLTQAETFIAAYLKGYRGDKLPMVGVYGTLNITKCVSILEGKSPLVVLGGQKVRSFYRNISDPSDVNYVTVDRHAKCAAVGIKNSDNSIVAVSEYDVLSACFKNVAARNGLIPCEFQAICWVSWRRIGGNIAQLELEFSECVV